MWWRTRAGLWPLAVLCGSLAAGAQTSPSTVPSVPSVPEIAAPAIGAGQVGSPVTGSRATANGAVELPSAPDPAMEAYKKTLPAGVKVEQATAEARPLSLDEAIDLGLKNNLQVELGRQNQRRVKGEVLSVENNLLPSLTATAYTQANELNLAAMGFKPSSLAALNLGFTIPQIVKVNVTDAQLSISQQVFNVPAYYLYRAAQKAGSAAEYAMLNARGGVALAVGTEYLQALAQSAQIENARALVKSDEVALRQAKDSHDAGVGTNLDVLRARVQLQTDQQAVIRDENDFAKMKIQLNRLMGQAAGQELVLTDTVPFAELADAPRERVLQTAYEHRKDLLTLEAQVEVATRTEKAVRYQRLPTLAFGGFYGVQGETTGLYHGVFSAQGSVSVPVFREAEFRGEAEVASAQVSGLRRQIDSLRVTIDEQIRASLLDVQTASDLVKVSRSNVALAGQEFDDASMRFVAGVADNLPVVQAQARVAAAESQLVSTMYQFNAAKLMLARNSGVVETQYKAYLGR